MVRKKLGVNENEVKIFDTFRMGTTLISLAEEKSNPNNSQYKSPFNDKYINTTSSPIYRFFGSLTF